MDSFDYQNVQEVKLLTSSYNNENQVNVELTDRFDQFKNEMEQKGISLEMRAISTKAAYDMVAHDRFIVGENVKYNVPLAPNSARLMIDSNGGQTKLWASDSVKT